MLLTVSWLYPSGFFMFISMVAFFKKTPFYRYFWALVVNPLPFCRIKAAGFFLFIISKNVASIYRILSKNSALSNSSFAIFPCDIPSVLRQKGESQNVCFKKTKHVKFPEKTNVYYPLITHTYYLLHFFGIALSSNITAFKHSTWIHYFANNFWSYCVLF